VELERGDVSTLPYSDESFDMAFAIQTIFFWRKPVDCLMELRRVLKTGGSLAVTIKPKDKMIRGLPPEFGTLYDSDEVASMLSSAVFRNVQVEHCPKPDKYPGDCILGVK
jgi:ubiquinone/menaquinone biosynthesis C-methylase UbiE